MTDDFKEAFINLKKKHEKPKEEVELIDKLNHKSKF